jgi:hypothetical protein
VQEEREAALEESRAVESHHKNLKVPLNPFFFGFPIAICSSNFLNNYRKNWLRMQIVIQRHKKQ